MTGIDRGVSIKSQREMVKNFEATMNDPYSVRLKDRRWAEYREEIFERDGYKCQVQNCGCKENLQAHHKYYLQGKMPWEVPKEALITVCESCHIQIHKEQESSYFVTRKARRESKFPLVKDVITGRVYVLSNLPEKQEEQITGVTKIKFFNPEENKVKPKAPKKKAKKLKTELRAFLVTAEEIRLIEKYRQLKKQGKYA